MRGSIQKLIERRKEMIEFKQEKVVKNINKKTGDSTSMREAKLNPNDECYTSMQDIIDELHHYKDRFAGKRIICPCDWDILDDEEVYSIRIDYAEGEEHGHINPKPEITLFDLDNSQKKIPKSEVEEFIRKRIKCNFIRTFADNAKKWGIKSITASGYNPETGKGISFEDVDYSKYDIVVTNPPFSLYKKFLNKVMTSGIDCILIAPLINRANPLEGEWIQDNKLFLGYNRDKSLSFINPTKENGYKTKNVAIDWITTFRDAQDELDNGSPYTTGVKYELYKDEYPVMDLMCMKDGTHPIKVNVNTIPDDYNGWMFGPISLLDKAIRYNEYEFYITNLKGYFNKIHPEMNPMTNKFANTLYKAKGETKNGFHGLLFRRKKEA